MEVAAFYQLRMLCAFKFKVLSVNRSALRVSIALSVLMGNGILNPHASAAIWFAVIVMFIIVM